MANDTLLTAASLVWRSDRVPLVIEASASQHLCGRYARFGWVLALFMMSASCAPSAEESPEPATEVFDRISACVPDVRYSERFLEQAFGWQAQDSAVLSSGVEGVVIDANGFLIELLPESEGCDSSSYRSLVFRSGDAAGILSSQHGADLSTLSGGTPIEIRQDNTPNMKPTITGATADARVDRLALIVRDVQQSSAFYSDVLGLRRTQETFELSGATNARSGGIVVNFVDANGVWLALVQPEGAGPLQDYLEQHGSGLIAELIIEVPSIASFYDRGIAAGYGLVDTRGEPVDATEKAHVLMPFGDRIAYFPTDQTGGLVIEIFERGPPETSLINRRDRSLLQRPGE